MRSPSPRSAGQGATTSTAAGSSRACRAPPTGIEPVGRRTRRPRVGRAVVPDLAPVGALLREAGFVGCADYPVSCRATYASDGSVRSVKARFFGGWCCRLTMHRNGSYSLTQSVSVKVRAVRC